MFKILLFYYLNYFIKPNNEVPWVALQLFYACITVDKNDNDE